MSSSSLHKTSPLAGRSPASLAQVKPLAPIRHHTRAIRPNPKQQLTHALPDITAETGAYVALGLSAVSFIGTFGIIPLFKDSFKEPISWMDIYPELAKTGVKTITAEEAYAKVQKGAVLVDVRLANKYENDHAAKSISVPLYQPIQNWDPISNIRRAGFAFFGIFGTEMNANFTQDAQAVIPKGKEVIVMCEMGGSMENKSGTSTGFQSRSLKAIYYLDKAGYTKVYHMKGGLSQWMRSGLPMASEEAQPLERRTLHQLEEPTGLLGRSLS